MQNKTLEATPLKPIPTIGTSGTATTFGDSSVANSGSIGSLNVGDQKKNKNKNTDTDTPMAILFEPLL